ncbi:hypothetical protein [Bacillus suaedae]|uniref:DUF3592 domain-containing protein n=1 Tax=Halalkalibacter suaedae TaxID=2822140 RepID=A0A941ATH4_9BACI|nr:hypothetical protein [Bacillus suaedae]MBP3951794.1 hypothetical protein [Bacillus suaedae]
MKRTLLFFILFILTFTSSVQALSWAYPFVVWNGNVYEVKEEKVLANQIGEEIGEVKTKPNDMTGNFYGNASNAYPKGTKYFHINNISSKNAIAVEVGDNEWQKAVYLYKAPFHWMDIFTKILPILVLIAIIIIVFILFKKRKNK